VSASFAPRFTSAMSRGETSQQSRPENRGLQSRNAGFDSSVHRLPLLTFDDGPSAFTDQLLDILARHGVRATFFVIGEQVACRRATVRRAVDAGHAVGNHSWDHPSLRALSEEAIRDQLRRTSAAIADATGVVPDMFRPPYGETDETVERVARELGLRQVLWDVDTRDWDLPGRDVVRARIASAGASEIVLLHDGGGESRADTVSAVGDFLDGSASPRRGS
jgi:peptidoglycan-N-acetylglucosamine deacetylase